MITSCSWVQPNGNDGTKLKGFGRRRIKLLLALVWLMLELHNGNVQHNEFSIDNIMLQWKLDGSLKIETHNLGHASHMSENVESLWHAKTAEAKES